MQSRPLQPHGIVLAPGPCVDAVEHTSHAWRRDGDQKEVRAQIRKSEVRPRSEQECRECDASPQEGHAQEWACRQGREGEEPQAGHRDRAFRGPEEGREGSAEEQLAQDFLAQELPKGRIPQELAEGRLEKELAEAFVVAAAARC